MRIITGKAKGLRLKTPKGLSTRPTAERVKESLFSILGGLINFQEINSVLDIFAGTGALGLEAISRGANSAVFIDNATAQLIRENISRTKFQSCNALDGDFEKILLKLAKQNLAFDLIFCDPPYSKNLAQKSLALIAEKNLLAEGSLMIIEHGAKDTLATPINFQLVRKIIYGQKTAITILERKTSS